MVGLQILILPIGVRVPVSQPIFTIHRIHLFAIVPPAGSASSVRLTHSRMKHRMMKKSISGLINAPGYIRSS